MDAGRSVAFGMDSAWIESAHVGRLCDNPAKLLAEKGDRSMNLQMVVAQSMRAPARALLVLALTALVACSSVQTTRPGVVGVERRQVVSSSISEEQLEAGSATAYAEVLSESRAKGALNSKPQQVARVRAIADRLIAKAGVFRDDAAQWQWEVNVIDSEEINAWAMPGGKMAVYTGIIDKLRLTDDELAAIMGHEISHVLREHSRERASRAQGQNLLVGVLGALVGASASTQQLANAAAEVAFALPNSRVQESEADTIGIELAARAGYDPRAAVSLWEKMARATESGSGPAFLSTHPSPTTRIDDLRALVPKVMPLYEQARS